MFQVTDRKWEIPRKWLIIDKTPLGEGEFGKVMRATVTSVTGIGGHRIVAAKMAKTGVMIGRGVDSGESISPELADLLSEFHLLKDVSHPNVIKLLGACTDVTGPFLLILEYCEHGSLRNYLRRSRLILPEQQQNPATVTATPAVTPRDLLSFAWQISQAGAYLCEMKVRHLLINQSVKHSVNFIKFKSLVGSSRFGGQERSSSRRESLQSFRFRSDAGCLRRRHLLQNKQRTRYVGYNS